MLITTEKKQEGEYEILEDDWSYRVGSQERLHHDFWEKDQKQVRQRGVLTCEKKTFQQKRTAKSLKNMPGMCQEHQGAVSWNWENQGKGGGNYVKEVKESTIV